MTEKKEVPEKQPDSNLEIPQTPDSKEAENLQSQTHSSSVEAMQETFPKSLLKELKEKFGARWSDMAQWPNRIIVESFEARERPDIMDLIDIDTYLIEHGATDIQFKRQSEIMEATIEGNRYEFISRSATKFESSRFDDVITHNLDELEKMLPEKPKVLYVGPYGDMRIRERFPDAVYLDITKDLLDPEDVKGDANDLPFKGESFDLIFFKDMNEPVINSQKVINETKRVLKNDGYIYSTGTFMLGNTGIKIEDPGQYDKKKHDKMKKLYEENGFDIVENPNFQKSDEIGILQKA